MAEFALANQEILFVVPETTKGVLQVPTSACRVYSTEPVDLGQERELIEDAQIRAGASNLPSIKARLMVGEWSFTTYVKASGTKGTAPEADALFTALLGKKTVSSNTKVEYTLEDSLPSLSIWVKKGHTVFAVRGASVETGEFSIAGDAVATVRWSGKFMQRLWAGTSTLEDALNIGDTQVMLPTGHAKRYSEGMYIKFGADDNSGAGYKITSVDYTLDTLTITPGVKASHAKGTAIEPWLPTAAAEVGAPVHGKLGLVTIDGVPAVVLSASLTVTNNIKYYDNEKNGVWTAEDFARPGKRTVEGTLSLFFLAQGLDYFYKADYHEMDALVIPAGSEDGSIMELSIPYAEYSSPKLSGTEEFLQELSFKAVASASLNDELKVIFR